MGQSRNAAVWCSHRPRPRETGGRPHRVPEPQRQPRTSTLPGRRGCHLCPTTHTRLVGDGRGRIPSAIEATSHTPRPLPGAGKGEGGVPGHPAHPLPLSLTLQLLTADHSLSVRKDIQTFHFPFCLVLGPVQTKRTRSQSQPQPQMATPHPHPAPPHPGTHGFMHSTGLALGSPRHRSTQQTTQTRV